MKKIFKWARTQDSKFLESFYMYAGIVRVFDFLTAIMNDTNFYDAYCVGATRMECIAWAAGVIAAVTYSGTDSSNKDIATKIATAAIDNNCYGLNTLIHPCREYYGGDDVDALYLVWVAL